MYSLIERSPKESSHCLSLNTGPTKVPRVNGVGSPSLTAIPLSQEPLYHPWPKPQRFVTLEP
jgi:hypothetical protein